MTKRLVFALFLAFSFRLAAQLPDGAIAPDFMAQDINGQSWHLYDLLADDKIVVLEISATWCPPCWTYHNGHALQNLYAAHGPAGDDRLRVFFIEGDPNTEVNCLYGQAGCSEYTPGNWVAGTDFPFIDNASIADAFQISYYPTIFIICPNKKTYEVNQLNADELWEKAQTCPVAFGNNNAGLYDYTTGSNLHEICDHLNLAPSFSLINLGNNALTDAAIQLRWNNSVIQTLQWNGNLPVYGEATLVFDNLVLDQPGTLTASLQSINALSIDEDSTNNQHIDIFINAQEFDDQQILLKIKTDQYGNETYWALRNEQGIIIDQGGNTAVGPDGGGAFPGSPPNGPGTYSSNTVINEILNLPAPGCYSLQFVDAYGDGMCCNYGNGYYKLYNYDAPGQLIMSGGVFEKDDYRAFGSMLSSVGTDENTLPTTEIKVFPNPVVDQVVVQITTAGSARMVSGIVFNSLGQRVAVLPEQAFSAGEARWALDASRWAPGLYAFRLSCEGRVFAGTFIKD